MYKQIATAIEGSRRVAILPHINPDGDCLGSAYALKLLLQGMGKEAQVFLEDGEAASRVMPILKGVEGGSLAGADLAIAVDCGDRGRLGARSPLFDGCRVTVNIDHHPTNPGFAQYNYVDPTAAATGELIFELARFMEAEVTADVAHNLYVAIASDSGGFAYANTRPRTHRIGAELLEAGVAHDKINDFLFGRNSLAELRLKGEALCAMETYLEGRIALMTVPQDVLRRTGADESQCGGLISLARSLDTALIALCLKETAEGVRVSMRSADGVDVARLAQRFGGGGHVRASGCTLSMGLEQAKQVMIQAAEEQLKQEGLA